MMHPESDKANVKAKVRRMHYRTKPTAVGIVGEVSKRGVFEVGSSGNVPKPFPT